MKSSRTKDLFILQSGRNEDELHILRRIMIANREIFSGMSHLAGVPATRIGVMRCVAVAGDRGTGIMEIARSLGLDAAAVTRQVTALEKLGLVRRTEVESDKRRVAIHLTEPGEREFRRVHERVHEVEKAILASLPVEDVQAAVRVLDAVSGAMRL